SGKYSDFVITCGTDTYNVHKSVVCARSDFFERAERFAAGKESKEGKVNLPEDDPVVVKLLIQYLYEGEYDPKLPDGDNMDESMKVVFSRYNENGYSYEFPHTCAAERYRCDQGICPHHYCNVFCHSDCVEFVCKTCCPNGAPSVLPAAEGDALQLKLHAKIYEIGDKYYVVGLKELAREKFLRACAKYWDDEHFAPVAHYAFSTTPEDDRGLRDVVINTISQHMVLLNKPAVEAMLAEFNGPALGLLKMCAKELASLLSSGKYSDLVITCGDDVYQVHKAIVCSQAGFFDRGEKFPVGKEAAENAIGLPEDDPAIINLPMQYLYTGEYDLPLPKNCSLSRNGTWSLNVPKVEGYSYSFPHTCEKGCSAVYNCPHHHCTDDTCGYKCVKFICQECVGLQPLVGDATQLLLHSQMYQVADKYDIPQLFILSQEKFSRACQEYWDDAAFPITIEHALSTTLEWNEGLRKTLHDTLALKPELLSKPGIEASLRKHTGFAFGVVKMQAEEMVKLKAKT
ncbi:hypothetical protein CC86DRAFT_299958, partial [Ophiobolus disseminans]